MDSAKILITIPHGGDQIPVELRGRTELPKEAIFWDGDGATREIYDFGHKGIETVSTDIARAFVDLNRSRTDLPPGNSDGVIKSHTCFGVRVYKNGAYPDPDLIETLLKKYYDPFHLKVDRLLQQKNIQLGIDCHSMLPVPPNRSSMKKRPAFCISNGGDQQGERLHPDQPTTCNATILCLLKQLLEEEFKLADKDVLLNDPFNGGHIIRSHFQKRKKPWLQVEINRNLYIKFSKLYSKDYSLSDKSIQHLREKLWDIFNRVAGIL